MYTTVAQEANEISCDSIELEESYDLGNILFPLSIFLTDICIVK